VIYSLVGGTIIDMTLHGMCVQHAGGANTWKIGCLAGGNWLSAICLTCHAIVCGVL